MSDRIEQLRAEQKERQAPYINTSFITIPTPLYHEAEAALTETLDIAQAAIKRNQKHIERRLDSAEQERLLERAKHLLRTLPVDNAYDREAKQQFLSDLDARSEK